METPIGTIKTNFTDSLHKLVAEFEQEFTPANKEYEKVILVTNRYLCITNELPIQGITIFALCVSQAKER